MPAKSVVLWKDESDNAPPFEICEMDSLQSEYGDATLSAPPNHRRRRGSVLGTSLGPSAAYIASSDCSSSICSESSVSLGAPSDASELLDEEEADHFRQAFELFDQDCDGLITAQEMGAVMRTLGYGANDVEAQRMVSEANTSGKDGVNFAEFLAVLAQQPDCPPEDGQEDFQALFKVFDKYDRGYITSTDLRHVMSSLNDTVTDREVDAMMFAADKDGDGLISYDEFVAIFSAP
ncbi:hypothetical protein MTO96_022581 [Rhipicephalus appendiculatus]